MHKEMHLIKLVLLNVIILSCYFVLLTIICLGVSYLGPSQVSGGLSLRLGRSYCPLTFFSCLELPVFRNNRCLFVYKGSVNKDAQVTLNLNNTGVFHREVQGLSNDSDLFSCFPS